MYSDQRRCFLTISPTSAACSSGIKTHSFEDRKTKKRSLHDDEKQNEHEKVRVIKGHDMHEHFLSVVESVNFEDSHFDDCTLPAKKQKCFPIRDCHSPLTAFFNDSGIAPCVNEKATTSRPRQSFIVKEKEMRSFFRLLGMLLGM